MKRTLCLLMTLSLFAGPLLAQVYAQDYRRSPSLLAEYDSRYDEPPGDYIFFDTFLLRPLGLVSMGVGLVTAAFSMPWAATSCTTGRVERELIQKPFQYTFTRPLGDIEDPQGF